MGTMTCSERIYREKENHYHRLKQYFRLIDESKNIDDMNQKIIEYHKRRNR